jgi:hypothetical protein
MAPAEQIYAQNPLYSDSSRLKPKFLLQIPVCQITSEGKAAVVWLKGTSQQLQVCAWCCRYCHKRSQADQGLLVLSCTTVLSVLLQLHHWYDSASARSTALRDTLNLPRCTCKCSSALHCTALHCTALHCTALHTSSGQPCAQSLACDTCRTK